MSISKDNETKMKRDMIVETLIATMTTTTTTMSLTTCEW